MLGRKRRLRDAKRRIEAERSETYKKRQAEGAALSKRISELRNVTDPARLPAAAMELFKHAQFQVGLIRQSIKDKTDYDFSVGELLQEGDLATHLAEDISGVMRENTCDPQTVWQALSDALPDVNFTVNWYDAVSMVAAMLRETYLQGVLEGMELAGLTIPKPNSQ